MVRMLQSRWFLLGLLLLVAVSESYWMLYPEGPGALASGWLLVICLMLFVAIAVAHRLTDLDQKMLRKSLAKLPTDDRTAYMAVSAEGRVLGGYGRAQQWLPVQAFVNKSFGDMIAAHPEFAVTQPLLEASIGKAQNPADLAPQAMTKAYQLLHNARSFSVSAVDKTDRFAKATVVLRFVCNGEASFAQSNTMPAGLDALLIKNSLNAKIFINEEGRIVEFNPAAEALLGYVREDVLNQPMDERIVPLRDRPVHRQGLTRFLLSGESTMMHRRVELNALHKNGYEIPVELMISELPTSQGMFFGAELRDLRTWRTMEQELRQAKERAELVNASKSRFLATMSHEIRTPLNAVLGILSLVQAEPQEPHQAELLATAENAGKRLMTLLTNVLDYSKIEAGEMQGQQEPFSPAQLIDEVVGLFRANVRTDQVDLQGEFSGYEDLWLLGDRQKVGQVLTNLISNAVKFTERGHIHIRLECDTDQHVESRYRIIVDDSGIGMTQTELGRVFDAFVQADDSDRRKYVGTGLGLSISKQLAEMMHGQLLATSVPKQGSTFVLELPMKVCPAPEPSEKPDMPRLAGNISRRILVVEDSKPNQLVVKAMLERNGFQVDVANTGAEACAAVQKKGQGNGAYGLILMDVQMPGMDGIEATRWIRNHGYDTPIVALTAKAFIEDEKACLEAGMNEFMTKPVQYETLLSRVHRWLGGPAPELQLPGERVDELRLLMGHDAFIHALAVFATDVQERLAALDAALSADDLVQAGAQLHTLFGIFAGYGFSEPQHLSKALEESCQAGLKPPATSVAQLHNLSAQLLQQIERFSRDAQP